MLEVLGVAEEGTGVVGLSPTLDTLVLEDALDARNVLFTDTALNVVGFFTDGVLECPLSSFFKRSSLEASVSEPPLKLTSAELTTSSRTGVWAPLGTLDAVGALWEAMSTS